MRIYCLLRNVNSPPGWFALIFMMTVALFSENGVKTVNRFGVCGQSPRTWFLSCVPVLGWEEISL